MQFLIPYVYGLTTRAKTGFYKLSFLIVIFLPGLFVSIFANGNIEYIIPRYIIAFTALYSVYEIGYIFNDTYTVRFEKNPTHRLGQSERYQVERLANLLVSVRVMVVIVCCILLKNLGIYNLTLFIIMLGLLNLSYALHNYFRNKVNIATIFFVLIFKYITVPVLFISRSDFWVYASVLIAIVPIVRTIEFAGKKEYGIKIFSKFNHDIFRVWYYFILSLIFLILMFFNKIYVFALVLAVYFFVFRIASIFLLNSKITGTKIKKIRKNDSLE